LYLPIAFNAEYDDANTKHELGEESCFDESHNIRFFNITKWVVDRDENSLEKLVNVYAVLENENCNIALVFDRKQSGTNVYMAIVNLDNKDSNTDISSYKKRVLEAMKGNFPGATFKENDEDDEAYGNGVLPCFQNEREYSIATATNIPTEKSEKFISQTIEKLLDGIVPDERRKEYVLILLATPIHDIDERKLKLGEFHSGLTPYASWQTNYTYTESEARGSSATLGFNLGASAGIQNGKNYTETASRSDSDSYSAAQGKNTSSTSTEGGSKSDMESSGGSNSTTETHTSGTSEASENTAGASTSVSSGVDVGPVDAEISDSVNVSKTSTSSTSLSDAIGKTATTTFAKAVTNTVTNSLSETVGNSVTNTVGRAVTRGMAVANGVSKAVNFGANAGASFARSSSMTSILGKNEGVTQNHVNYNIKHAIELLEKQMKRLETSTALGMWDFAAYVLSEDREVANNVAHTYLALTMGEESYLSNSAINVWRSKLGNDNVESESAKEIVKYLKQLRHPIFAINPDAIQEDSGYLVYPTIVNATTSLSGKELAYALNFPKKSVTGLPVVECAQFGRNIVSYDEREKGSKKIKLGKVFHMNRPDEADVELSINSFASHVFITGSTGSGKSNTIYTLLEKAKRVKIDDDNNKIKFMVIEPAKGEYKNVFGNAKDVSVYGTNPLISELLRINPFSFPVKIHVLEHLDRLVEIFNVCWPMYAAMPAVLKNAIEKAYEDCGWNLEESINEFGYRLYPNFDDVKRNVKTIIDSSEYDTENKGAYKGSLLTRIESLCNGLNGMIFTSNEIDDEKLFDENVIVDLSRVGSAETKSLIMGMIVLKLQEYRMVNTKGMNIPLRHITVLEEAHNILRRTSIEQSAESSNLAGKSVEMLANSIAEMRTYGEGFIIADQAPGLMDMSVIRNTNTKIILRLPDYNDRQLVGAAANLNESQIIELAKLPRGVAAVYQNEWIDPILCKVDRSKSVEKSYEYEKYNRPISDTTDLRVEIASILSKGLKYGKEVERDNLKREMDEVGLSAYYQTIVFRALDNQDATPRMTKIAPVMCELFPMVKEAVKKTYTESRDEKLWTLSAVDAIPIEVKEKIDDQVQRDIVQSAITQYILLELNKEKELRDWSVKGGF